MRAPNRASFDAALMFKGIRTGDAGMDEFDTGLAGDLVILGGLTAAATMVLPNLKFFLAMA
jgi:hypothetical protein